ncbi:carbonic anhydrase [Bifidobacterium thermophilum]|uniref:Carbonic anhydrase n=1 Tax=Bifidobacterium thermophilum TaxID=33905 RepID=A0A7X9RL61_9BIFI|nr:carbonic anhydrase [Bifidobacterium thermophilum]NME62268.1 carbonic anhydrase [Bifidobacterium thermophilum]
MADQTHNDDDVQHEPTATSTWSRLLAGNRRFAQGKMTHAWQDRETRESLLDSQRPDAAVLSCSDSRVPPEIIFDAGLGDMFTVRTAGQIIDDSVLASLEYAVDKLHVSLLVILGHQHCGAIQAAETQLGVLASRVRHGDDSPETAQSLASIIDEIEAMNDAQAAESVQDQLEESLEHLVAEATSPIVRSVGPSVLQAYEAQLRNHEDIERVHIAHTIEELVDRSQPIQQALADERLMLVGARYCMDTGLVEVLSF